MLDSRPKLKRFLLAMLMHPYSSRPRWWARVCVIPFFIKRGRGSIIRRTARLDLIPSKRFVIGYRTIIEDYVIINNGMGDITVGDNSQILSRSKLVGPVSIGNNVILSSGSHVTGMIHDYQDVTRTIREQGCSTSITTIEDDVWIGGNSAINQGVRIGKHSVIGTCSVVTRDIPPYSVAVGNPARVIRHYDFAQQQWVKTTK